MFNFSVCVNVHCKPEKHAHLAVMVTFWCAHRFIASRKSLPNWLFASLISGFGLPGSFLFWHRNLYKAAITDGTFRYANSGWVWENPKGGGDFVHARTSIAKRLS